MTHTGIQTESALVDQHQILAAIPGLTYRRLDWWTRKGWLRIYDETGRPDPVHTTWLGTQQHGPGSGIARRWEAADIPVLRRVVALTTVGMQPGPAFTMARLDVNPVQLNGFTLTFDGDLA